MTRRIWRRLGFLVLLPLPLLGQQASQSARARAQINPPSTAASLYGAGGFELPSPEGLVGSRDLLSFGTNVATGYDDNVRQNNEGRLAGTSFAISPWLAVNHQDGRLATRVSYKPTLFLYRHHSTYNEQDHNLDVDATYHFTSRLELRVQSNLLDRRGVLESPSIATPDELAASPGLLNNSITTPFANQFEDNSRADISYALTPRSAVGVFATYMVRSFGKSTASSPSPFSTKGESEGLRYVYRTSPRTTLGLSYLHETFLAGEAMRVGLNAALLDWTFAVTRHLEIVASAGPVHSRLRGSLLVPLGPVFALSLPIRQSDWHWAASAGARFETAESNLQVNGSRQVTDGGGLLEAVTSDAIGESFERRISRLWSVQFSTGWQRNLDLASAGQPGQLEGEYGRIVILRAISESLKAGVGYQFQRQQADGVIPLGASFDRNYVYFEISYRIQNFPLGR
jgi:hypothetical protein